MYTLLVVVLNTLQNDLDLFRLFHIGITLRRKNGDMYPILKVKKHCGKKKKNAGYLHFFVFQHCFKRLLCHSRQNSQSFDQEVKIIFLAKSRRP